MAFHLMSFLEVLDKVKYNFLRKAKILNSINKKKGCYVTNKNNSTNGKILNTCDFFFSSSSFGVLIEIR